MLEMHSFAWWPTLIVLAVATFTDLRTRRIPNWLVFPFLLSGIVVSPLRHDWNGNSHGFGWHGLGQSLAGLGLSLLINIIPFFMGWTGGGDLKLYAGIGAWVGPAQFFWSIFFSSFAGGIMVLGLAAYSGFLKELFASTGQFILGWKKREMSVEPVPVLASPMRRAIPKGPAIAIGTVVSFFVG
jgi:prepilin peptidase CpaA